MGENLDGFEGSLEVMRKGGGNIEKEDDLKRYLEF